MVFGITLKRLARLLDSKATCFDREYYLLKYPDVARSGQDPLSHFNHFGWREGRNPSPTFYTLFFKDKYLVGHGAEVNPLEYYQKNKFARQLKTAPDSDEEYLSLQKDVVSKHFDEFFYREGSVEFVPRHRCFGPLFAHRVARRA